MLAAFSEATLRKADRDAVLGHLAVCRDCRDVLVLMLPEAEVGVLRQEAPRPERWRFIRWAAVAACCAVIGVGGLWQLQRHGQRQVAKLETYAVSVQREQLAASSNSRTAAAMESGSTQKAEEQQSKIGLKKTGPLLRDNVASEEASAGVHDAPLAKAYNKLDIAHDSAAQAPSVENQPARSLEGLVRAKPATGAVTGSATVESYEGDRAAVVPVPAARGAGIAAVALAAPRWQISPTGSLQRSLDEGVTWQDFTILPTRTGRSNSLSMAWSGEAALASPQPSGGAAPAPSARQAEIRALYTSGSEIWAGGAGGAIFHSQDSGARWVRVVPATQLRALTGDVVKISFDDPLHGSVTTSTKEVWTTSDGGRAWRVE